MNFEKCKKHELIAHAQKLGISNKQAINQKTDD
jgi:hypothetical protein